jgi:hypothetical protein
MLDKPEISNARGNQEIQTRDQKLRSVGLEALDLQGKRVLDVNSLRFKFLRRPRRINKFLDKSFDIIIATDGDIQGNPWNRNVIDLYVDALGLIKNSGEIRIHNPFQGYKLQETDPVDWTPEKELEYLLYNEGLDATVDVVTRENDQGEIDSYIILKKMPKGE